MTDIIIPAAESQAIAVRVAKAIATHEAERIRGYLENRRAANTQRTYASAWRDFAAWYAWKEHAALPASPQTVAAHLSAMADAGTKPATLSVRLAAIGAMHRERRLDDPSKDEGVKAVMSGIRRTVGTAQRKAAPVTRTRLQAFVEAHDAGTLVGLRNRAMLLTGFAGAFRESELAGLLVEDIRWQEDGSAMILVRRSKTDQEGAGKWKPLPRLEFSDYCPASAVRAWLDASRITSGPLFRRIYKGGKRVGSGPVHRSFLYHLVKGTATATGLDAGLFSGHSLRSGFATQHSEDGGAPMDGMEVTGHKDMRTFMGYARTGGKLARRASTLALTGKNP